LNDTQQQLENKERELNDTQQQLENKERELNDTQQQLENKERELNDTQQRLENKERELQRAQEIIRVQHQTLKSSDHNWVVSKDEIELTDQVLGEGAYGNVRVAIFRGLRIAGKCLHNLIISEYNLALFSREMDIASRVRHPNLVQFIGATTVGNPIILMELMRTSLYSELQKKSLTHPQIIGISHDVALALNYLHQWKPNPIIHRDISSPNILLDPSIGDTYKAKVTDYGTANLQSNVMTYMPGNPAYASPEARDPEIQSPQMDVYSYSVVLMEMVLHRPPCMTIREREEQSKTITSWPSMKSLIQRGISSDRTTRPNMSQILHLLKQL
jgi:serine/threonine protein kinase